MSKPEPLCLPDRIQLAREQMEMTMESGVMTTRSLGSIAEEWGDGDGSDLLAALWNGLVDDGD